MDPDGKVATDDDEEVLSERMPTKEEQELMVVQQQQQQQQLQQATTNQVATNQGSNKTTTVTVTIDRGEGGLYKFLMRAFKSPDTPEPDTPEGYNSKRRFMARWILWGVVFGLLRPRLLIVALICSVSSIVVLKEGTIFSGKNLKWTILSMISFGVSVLSWSFRRAHNSITATIEEDEEGRRHPILKTLQLVLHLSSKWMVNVLGAILGVFLLSAFLGSKKDQEAFKAAVV